MVCFDFCWWCKMRLQIIIIWTYWWMISSYLLTHFWVVCKIRGDALFLPAVHVLRGKFQVLSFSPVLLQLIYKTEISSSTCTLSNKENVFIFRFLWNLCFSGSADIFVYVLPISSFAKLQSDSKWFQPFNWISGQEMGTHYDKNIKKIWECFMWHYR